MVDQYPFSEGWLEDTSLFGDESIPIPNIDDIFEKLNSKGTQPDLNLLDLGWFGENANLYVLDNSNGLQSHHDETQPLMEDASAVSLGWLDNEDIFKNEGIPIELDLLTYPASSEVLDTHLASLQYDFLQIDSPEFEYKQSPSSPYSDISDAQDVSSGYVLQSPEVSSVTSDFTNSSLDSSPIQVSVCDSVLAPSSSEPVLSIEEISRSVRKRKFVNNGETKPKVIKVMFPESTPVRLPKTKESKERKKVQNKEAAARYRVKKRIEERVLSDEVEGLELEQKKLNEKHNELKTEIKYLKSLMCEILTKKGIMK